MNTYSQFIASIQFWGRLTLLLAALLSFGPAVYLYLAYGLSPDISQLFGAFAIIASFMVISYVLEPMTYYPVLGLSGTYMSWLAGNISNLRLPVSAVAQLRVGVKQGSPEGDIISTISIGVSIVVNLIVLLVVAMLGQEVLTRLPENILGMFEYVLPSVMGALLFLFAQKSMTTCAILLAATIGLNLMAAPGWSILIVCILGGILLSIWLEKRKLAASQPVPVGETENV
ncbi:MULTISPECIES: hypothetical protein [Photobacterium]|uniref:Uncharacterized protein n=1 Tax=Photobacterium halotolerans TaxID=265726 RepID=A0A0F5VDL6_9GAMM|nr:MULTISPECIES: hypothetical protein [Photobacterium]KKD00163.1 hypothetical protein KY46_09790 [Photobacterium halotolerans]UIP28028.1 hypothetical protein LN341_00400 [Photobacterium sp. TLY01]